MANYVSNKVICTKAFFDKYFLDPYSLGEEDYDYCKKEKYISFNKLFDVKSIYEYYDNYGANIYYGFWYCTKEIDNEHIELMFKTKWRYPMCAILKAINLDHSIIWYALEDNAIYISKFIWDNDKVIEKTLNIENDDFYNWYDKNVLSGNTYDNIHMSDDSVWYYDYESRKDWMTLECDDLIKRYKNCYPASDYYMWFDKQSR